MNISELKNWTAETGLYKTGHGYSYWVEILSNEAKAPKSGLYLFVCLDDNQLVYALAQCTCKDNLLCSMIEANQNHEPDSLLAFHPIAPYSTVENSWVEYRSGDTARINGIFVWFIRKGGEEMYVYRNYRKGDDMLTSGLAFYHNDIYDEFRDYEFIAYHGCFYYTQLGLHNELFVKFNKKEN